MIVVDTNAVAALLLPTEATAHALAWWRHDPLWAAPPLLFSELCNVLLGEVRRGHVSLVDATELADEAARRVRWLARPASGAILAAAFAGSLTAYDAEFVAAAEAADGRLLTGDRAIIKAYPALCWSLRQPPSAT